MAANGNGWPPAARSAPSGPAGVPPVLDAAPADVWSPTDPDEPRTAERPLVLPSGPAPSPPGPAASHASPAFVTQQLPVLQAIPAAPTPPTLTPFAAPPPVPPGAPPTLTPFAPPFGAPPVAPPFAGPSEPLPEEPGAGRTRTGMILAAAGLTLLVVAGAVVAVKLTGSGSGGAPPAVAQGADPERAGNEVVASGTPDGERVPASPLPSASVPPAKLKPGFRLDAGQALRSPNGKYTLTQQPDGNLVLADDAKRMRWSSQTPANPGAHAGFDRDGDLAVYAKGGGVLWRSATGGKGALLEVRDDGNAVVSQAGGQEAWSSQAERGRLYAGQALLSGQQRRSADGRFTLAQQPDGNLVVVDAAKKILWSAQTGGHTGATTQLQNDGNLVVYGADKAPLFSSGTFGAAGVSAVLNADGNVVLTAGGKVLWATTTDGVSKVTTGQRLLAGQSRSAPKGGWTLLQQPDGNLVLQSAGKSVVWRSGTGGHPGASTRMQPDGNLVVYDTAGKALWSTATYGKGATYLLVQDDGSAVLYTAAKKAVWTSKPA